MLELNLTAQTRREILWLLVTSSVLVTPSATFEQKLGSAVNTIADFGPNEWFVCCVKAMFDPVALGNRSKAVVPSRLPSLGLLYR